MNKGDMPHIVSIKKKNAHFVQMFPNSFLEVLAPNIENIEVSSNVFADIEVVRDGPCIKIHIVGKPRVKQIIFDNINDDGQ